MSAEKRFDGQVAIVTGAGEGMGREHAKLLASRGASVVVNDISKSAEETVKIIKDNGGTAVANHDDVSSADGAASIVDTALSNFDRIDILVSNAGVIKNVPFAEMDVEEFDRVMKINAYGAFHVAKAVWPHFMKQKYGRVVLVSSPSAYVSQPDIGHYAASKGAVMGLGKSLAPEGAAYGITVNILMPGAFTKMAGNLDDKEAQKRMEKVMSPSLVSPVVAWLVHKDNEINGEIIEGSSGRAATNFVGSAKGYWKKDLTIEDLVENKDKVLSREGYQVLEDTTKLINWMADSTGWDK